MSTLEFGPDPTPDNPISREVERLDEAFLQYCQQLDGFPAGPDSALASPEEQDRILKLHHWMMKFPQELGPPSVAKYHSPFIRTSDDAILLLVQAVDERTGWFGLPVRPASSPFSPIPPTLAWEMLDGGAGFITRVSKGPSTTLEVLPIVTRDALNMAIDRAVEVAELVQRARREKFGPLPVVPVASSLLACFLDTVDRAENLSVIALTWFDVSDSRERFQLGVVAIDNPGTAKGGLLAVAETASAAKRRTYQFELDALDLDNSHSVLQFSVDRLA